MYAMILVRWLRKEKMEMANLTKVQIRNRVAKLYEQIDDLKCELEGLQGDVECERDDIEPYEGRDELTQSQEERSEWLDGSANSISSAVDRLGEALESLDEVSY